MEEFKKTEIPKLVMAILIPLIIGFIGAIATFNAIPTFFAALNKPIWTPPNWAFGPIWTILYILIGIALFLVWRNGFQRQDVKIAMGVFGVQIALNLLWSLIFFGAHSILGGLIEIIFLWIAILINIILFYKISKVAGILLLPYIVWVTIALYLNYSIYLLNY